MSLLFQAYPLLRPSLFNLEPEKAHDVTLGALKRAHELGLSRLFPKVAAHPVHIMGLALPNPVGLAAGLDKSGAYVDALGTLGFGFLEVGTVTPRPQPGNPVPRVFRIPEGRALINRMGFNSDGLPMLLANLQHSQWRRRGGILGLNIGKNFDTPNARAVDDYQLGLAGVYPHADYITINVSSPNTKDLRALQGADELSSLLSRLHEVRERLADGHGRRVPMAVKIAPDLEPEQVDVLADLLPRHGIDGVIATNTTVKRDGVAGMPNADEAGGLSGPPVRELSTRVIERMRRRVGKGLAIIGVGGIHEGRDAVEKMAAGADAVQLYTGLVYRGPALIGECARALRQASPR